MSYIQIARTRKSNGLKEYLKKLKLQALTIDPYSDSVDWIEFDIKNVSSIVFHPDEELNCTFISYKSALHGIERALVYVDDATANMLDNWILESNKDSEIAEYFPEAFTLCWDFHNPNAFRLFYCPDLRV